MATKEKNELLNEIKEELDRVVVGKKEIKKLLLTALLAQGHILIEGLPGTAKTILARTFAGVLGGGFKRVQGTPDMLPADILGFCHYRQDGSGVFMPGPIFANVVLVDELNRLSPRTQSALLQAMQEHQVTIERDTHNLERPFMVIASQLPYGSVGTSSLSDVQIDRFMFRVWSGFPSAEEESRVLQGIDEILTSDIKALTSAEVIIKLQEEVKKIHVDEGITKYIVSVVNSLRQHSDVAIGPSPRGSIAVFNGARASAFIQGRQYVIPDDVKELLVPALGHRLQLKAEASIDDISTDSIVEAVVAEIPVPKV